MNVLRERVATALVFFCFGLSAGIWATNIPRLKERFALDDLQLGLTLFGAAAGGIAGMFLVRMPIARAGAGRTALACTTMLIALFCIPAILESSGQLKLFAILFGLTNGALNVSINTYAGGVQKVLGKPTMSLFHAIFSSGCVSGAICVSTAVGLHLDYLESQTIFAGALLVLLLVAASTGLHSQQEATTIGAFHLGGLDRRLLLFSGLAFLCVMTEGAVADWGAVYMKTIATGSPIGLAYASFALCMATGRFAGDAIVHYLGWLLVAAAGGALAAIGFALALVYPCPLTAAIGFGLVGFGLSNFMPILFSVAGQIDHGNRARGISVTAMAGSLGGMIGPSLIGSLAQLCGIRVALIVLIFTTATLSLSTWRIIQRPQES